MKKTTILNFFHTRVVRVCVGAAMLGVGFVAPPLWPLALVGMAPLVSAFVRQEGTWWSTFRLGWLAGAIVYGFALYSIMWDVLPLDWLGVHEPSVQFIFAAFVWTLASAVMAVATGVFAVGVRKYALRDWRDVFLIPSMWVIAEVCSIYLFQGAQHGSGALFVQPHFTLGLVGYQLAESVALLQLAWLGGVFLLSWTAALCGVVLYRVAVTHTSRERRTVLALGAVALVVWLGATFALSTTTASPSQSPSDTDTISVAVVQTHLMGSEGDERQLAMQRAVADQPATVDLVVLPEEAEYFAKLATLGEPYPTGARSFLDSGFIETDGVRQYQANYYDTQTKDMQHTYKRVLLPVGEYLPYVTIRAGQLFGIARSASFQRILSDRQYTPGPVPEPVTLGSGARVGFLFCNEVMSPFLYHSLTQHGAHILVNTASHLWFHGSRAVFTQMQHIAQVRAVESGRWYLQSTNSAPAFILDARGRIVHETGWNMGDGVIRASVPLRSTRTPYSTLGPWGVLIVCVIIIGICTLPRLLLGMRTKKTTT